MTGDWAAVARAVNQRMDELGLKQREVVTRSDLSKATVREIQKNIKPRKRKPRTLESLSKALDWHPDHLAASLAGRTPPEPGKPFAKSPDDIAGRLDVIEDWLGVINDRLDRFDSTEQRLIGFVDEIRAGQRQILLHLRPPGR